MSDSTLPPEQWRPLFDKIGVEFGYRPFAAHIGMDHTRLRRLLRGGGTSTDAIRQVADGFRVDPSVVRELRGERGQHVEPFTLPDDAGRLNETERNVVRAMVRALLDARDNTHAADLPATDPPAPTEDTQDPQGEVQKTAQQEFAYIDLASLQGYDRLLLQNIAMTRLVLRRPHRPPESDQKLVQLIGEMHDGAINRAQLSVDADSPVALTAVDYAEHWKQSKADVMAEFEQILAADLRPELTDTQELDRLMAERESAEVALAAVDHKRLDELAPQLADISAQLREYEIFRHHVVSEMSAQVRDLAPTASKPHELRGTQDPFDDPNSEGVEWPDGTVVTDEEKSGYLQWLAARRPQDFEPYRAGERNDYDLAARENDERKGSDPAGLDDGEE